MLAHLYTLATTASGGTILADPKNPFDGVSPNPGAFGTGINSVLVLILGGVWGIVLIIEAIYCLIHLLKWQAARKDARTDDVTEASGAFKVGLIVFALTIGLPVVIGAIIFVVSSASTGG